MPRTDFKQFGYDFILDLTNADQEEFVAFISKLEAGETHGMNREKLSVEGNTHLLFSFRTNGVGRVLATEVKFTIDERSVSSLILISYLSNHEYDRSPFLQKGYLSQYLKSSYQALEGQVRLHCNKKSSTTSEINKVVVQKSITHLGRCVFLSEDQFKILNEHVMKKVIIGMPGSGKTLLELELVKKVVDRQMTNNKLLLLTHSDVLAYETQAAIKKLNLNHNVTIHIFSWKKFLLTVLGSYSVTVTNKKTLSGWIENYLKKLSNKNHPSALAILKEGERFSRDEKEIIAQEFTIISACVNTNDYIEGWGLTISSLKEKAHRMWLAEAFLNYQAYLKQTNQIDIDLVSIDQLPEVKRDALRKEYDAVFFDESQNASLSTLKVCCDLFEDSELTFLYDHDQAIEDIYSKTNFIQQYTEGVKYFLSGTYRCPPSLLGFLREILDLKRILTGGVINNDQKRDLQYSESQTAHHAEKAGVIEYFESETEMDAAFLAQIKQADRVAILTRKTEWDAAKKIYGSSVMIFSDVKDLQGIELDYLIAHDYLNETSLSQVSEEIKRRQLGQSFDTLVPVNKPKSGKENFQYEIPLNELVVLVSRPKMGLVIVNPKRKAIEHFLDWLKARIKLIKTKHGSINLNTIIMTKESDEELANVATKLILGGNEEQAKVLLTARLKKSEQEVKKFVHSVMQDALIVSSESLENHHQDDAHLMVDQHKKKNRHKGVTTKSKEINFKNTHDVDHFIARLIKDTRYRAMALMDTRILMSLCDKFPKSKSKGVRYPLYHLLKITEGKHYFISVFQSENMAQHLTEPNKLIKALVERVDGGSHQGTSGLEFLTELSFVSDDVVNIFKNSALWPHLAVSELFVNALLESRSVSHIPFPPLIRTLFLSNPGKIVDHLFSDETFLTTCLKNHVFVDQLLADFKLSGASHGLSGETELTREMRLLPLLLIHLNRAHWRVITGNQKLIKLLKQHNQTEACFNAKFTVNGNETSLIDYIKYDEIANILDGEGINNFLEQVLQHRMRTPSSKEISILDSMLDLAIDKNDSSMLHRIITNQLKNHPNLLHKIVYEKSAYDLFRTTYVISELFLSNLMQHEVLYRALTTRYCVDADAELSGSVLDAIVDGNAYSDIELLYSLRQRLPQLREYESVDKRLVQCLAILDVDKFNSVANLKAFFSRHSDKHIELSGKLDAKYFIEKLFELPAKGDTNVMDNRLYCFLAYDAGIRILLKHLIKKESLIEWIKRSEILVDYLLSPVDASDVRYTPLDTIIIRQSEVGANLLLRLVSQPHFLDKLVRHPDFFDLLTQQHQDDTGHMITLLNCFARFDEGSVLNAIVSHSEFIPGLKTRVNRFGVRHVDVFVASLLSASTLTIYGDSFIPLPVLPITLLGKNNILDKLTLDAELDFFSTLIRHPHFPAVLSIEIRDEEKASSTFLINKILSCFSITQLVVMFNDDVFIRHAINTPAFISQLFFMESSMGFNFLCFIHGFRDNIESLFNFLWAASQAELVFDQFAKSLVSPINFPYFTVMHELSTTNQGIKLLKTLLTKNKLLANKIMSLISGDMEAWFKRDNKENKESQSIFTNLLKSDDGKAVLDLFGVKVHGLTEGRFHLFSDQNQKNDGPRPSQQLKRKNKK